MNSLQLIKEYPALTIIAVLLLLVLIAAVLLLLNSRETTRLRAEADRLAQEQLLQEKEALLKEQKRKIHEQEMEEELLATRMRLSMAQLHPHFLYNALASIREIVLEDPEYGAELIYDFTVHLRSCLKAAESNQLIDFTAEMENVRAYVAIEKMRFGNRFSFETDFESMDFKIIPLGIQPLVENAIRHGICEARGRKGKVKVSSRLQADEIVITVEDDGQGFDYQAWFSSVAAEKSDSIGLKSVLLSFKYRMNARCWVDTEPEKGTKITIRIPGDNSN